MIKNWVVGCYRGVTSEPFADESMGCADPSADCARHSCPRRGEGP